MAIGKGPNGQFIGKSGNTVYYMLNGQYVNRTIGAYNGKPTIRQKANFQAMSLTMDFLRPIKDFINVSFGLEARGTTKNAHNLATSYIKKNAVQGEYPNLSIDYSKVILSNGNGRVPVAKDVQLTKTDEGVIVSWDPGERDYYRGRGEDSAMILLSFPGIRDSRMYFNAAKRSAGKFFVPLSKKLLDQPMETFMCFRSADATEISDSMYVGNLNGQAETAQDKLNKKKYMEVKTRFDIVEASYMARIAAEDGAFPNDKAFRTLVKEYEVLQETLRTMPGKPE